VSNRLRELSDEVKKLETKLREAGGAKRLEKLHQQGKLSARERVELLRDSDSSMLEIGLLVAYDQYEGQAPAAGVVTAIVRVHGRETVVVANDATVKAVSWWPETIKKILRAQEIAMRCRIPIVYLVDSAGVNLPYQEGVFPGQYGAARIFYYNSIMRRYLHIPQIAAVMGQCIAGGAYLLALSDDPHGEGHIFAGARGPNCKGRNRPGRGFGDARRRSTHTEISGVAHYALDNDEACRQDPRSDRAAAHDVRDVASAREIGETSASEDCGADAPQRRNTNTKPAARKKSCRTYFLPTTACRTTCTRYSARSWITVKSTSFRRGSRKK
jgi:hypothetical protein